MKILIVGHGGREHALLWKLHRDDPAHELLITRGNGGTGALARAVDLDPTDVHGLTALAAAEAVDFTIVGPEVPLAAGIVDAFRAAGHAIFGPERAAARLEASKAFAKTLMRDAGVPTAEFGVFRDRAPAAAFAARIGPPCVVKASGLAAGKGAFVCAAPDEVEGALAACFDTREFGAAGGEVVVEEYLEGEELSMIALTDGETLLPLLPSQDHKRAFDGDRGPNTGGMGAYAPVSRVDRPLERRIMDDIFRPTLAALADSGVRFSGCMYAGLMLTATGPQVLEWNARFGDPETQAILPLLTSDLLELLRATVPPDAGGEDRPSLAELAPRWRSGTAVTVVAAARGYPGDVEKGAEITLPSELSSDDAFESEGVVVFHAGTRRDGDRLIAASGRVLNVSAVGEDIADARRRAYAALDRIDADALFARRDIGWREVARTAGARSAPRS